ncbi:MAG: CPBP family intramembrane glutamic endopeptidase [Anaerolineales bacterium]|jgi:membrane protease YdiL (CAAX protease family)
MTRKQKILILSSPFVLGSMYPVFQILAAVVGETLGWYLGLVIYWILWGGLFSLWMVDKEKIINLIKPQKLNRQVLFLVVIPLILAGLFRFLTGTVYEKHSFWVLIMLLSTSLGNGFFEEVLWRGVFLVQFPEKLFFRIVWSSVWFGLWHIAPGSVSLNSNPTGLVIGALFFGFYLSYLANKTGTIWWSMVAHVLGGLVIVL